MQHYQVLRVFYILYNKIEFFVLINFSKIINYDLPSLGEGGFFLIIIQQPNLNNQISSTVFQQPVRLTNNVLSTDPSHQPGFINQVTSISMYQKPNLFYQVLFSDTVYCAL